MDLSIYVAKTKVLIRCTVTAQLIRAFVFAEFMQKAGFLMMWLTLYAILVLHNMYIRTNQE